MRVNMDAIKKTKRVDSLKVGDAFISRRTNGNELGVYMVVDNNSGLACRDTRNILTVNVCSGQLRNFPKSAEVEPVDAEVKVSIGA